MVGFRKGALGSPWQRETYSDAPMDIGDAQYGEDGPRIGPGVLKKVRMEVQRSAGTGKDRGGSSDKDD